MDDIKVNWATWVIKAFGSVCPSSFIFFCPAPESQWWCWFSDLLASLQAFDHADSLLKSISSQQVSLRQAMFPYDLHLIAQLSLHSGGLRQLEQLRSAGMHAGLTFFLSLLLILQTKICALCFRCDPNSLFWRFCRLQVPKVKPSPWRRWAQFLSTESVPVLCASAWWMVVWFWFLEGFGTGSWFSCTWRPYLQNRDSVPIGLLGFNWWLIVRKLWKNWESRKKYNQKLL